MKDNDFRFVPMKTLPLSEVGEYLLRNTFGKAVIIDDPVDLLTRTVDKALKADGYVTVYGIIDRRRRRHSNLTRPRPT